MNNSGIKKLNGELILDEEDTRSVLFLKFLSSTFIRITY